MSRIRSFDVTLSGETQIASALGHTPVQELHIENPTGNATVQVGAKDHSGGLSATQFGRSVAAGAAIVIGSVGGVTSLNLEDVRLKGTDTQVVHVLVITL